MRQGSREQILYFSALTSSRVRSFLEQVDKVLVNEELKYSQCLPILLMRISYRHQRFDFPLCFPAGDAGRTERIGWTVCSQNIEKRCGDTGWWCRVYHGWETSPSFARQAAFPNTPSFLLPYCGMWSHIVSIISLSDFPCLQDCKCCLVIVVPLSSECTDVLLRFFFLY